jgi:hypothetical protein
MLLLMVKSGVLPRTLHDRSPGVRAVLVVLLVGTAVAYGAANPCRDQGVLFGVGVAATAGLGCAAFRDKPGRLALLWRQFIQRVNPPLLRMYRSVVPFAWRWGVLCAVAGLVSGVIRGFREVGCS